MLSNKGEQRSFRNGRLRDQWEKRVQTIADQCKQEGQLKEKSSLKLLFSKWNYHWALAADGDKTKGETSKATSEEAEKNKPKIKFKIVPPPPPKPKSKPAPPPSRGASPQPLIVKRKVEVDIFRLHWKESWMSLKPPKYLFLKANETKTKIQGFTTIDVVRDKKYKFVEYASEPECISTLDWSHSWKQVKVTTLPECYGEKRFQWDILFHRDVIPNPEIGVYQLPLWAGTWKIMNFAFRQQKQKWDCEWPAFQLHFSNKFDDIQQLLEQDEPPGWEDSWRLSKATVRAEDCTLFELTVEMMNDVLLPGWNKSWLISAPVLQEEDDRANIWSSCRLFRLQLRWCRSSLQSHQRHSNMMTRRRNILNSLLTSKLNDVNTDNEWWDSWRTLKRWNPPDDDGLDEVQDNDSKVYELFNDTEEEDEGVDNDEENDGLDEEETEDEEEGSEDEKEEDEGVDEEEDTDNEYIEEHINIKTETHNGQHYENETMCHKVEEDTENENEELEEDSETHEIKPQNNNNDLHNHEEEDEDEDNGMADAEEEDQVNELWNEEVDVKEEKGVHELDGDMEVTEEAQELNEYDMDNDKKAVEEKGKVDNDRKNDKCMDEDLEVMEEHGNVVKEEQVYRNITLQLREILRMISNEKDGYEEEKHQGEDRESTKTQGQVEQAAREKQSDMRMRQDDTNKEEEDEAGYLQEKEEDEFEEENEWSETEEEQEEVKEKEEGEEEVEEKDLRKDIEEEDEGEVETDDDKEAIDDEDDKEKDQEKTDAEDDDSDEGDEERHEWANNAPDKRNMKKHADCEWGKDMKEQSRRADREEELQEADEDEEDEVDAVEKYVSEEDKGNENGNIEKEKKDQKSRKPIKCKPNVPLHLQFHKLNTSFSSWKQSWMVAVAHRRSHEDDEEEGEQEELKAWRESWRVCRLRKTREDKVACFSTGHQRVKHERLMNEGDGLPKKEWTRSWKMTKKGEDIK